MSLSFTATARRLGIVSAAGTVVIGAVYGIVLAVGLLTLPSSLKPIGDPSFSILEILIILEMPFMVALMVAIHAWAQTEVKVLSLMALVSMIMVATVTCSVHFAILLVSRQPTFSCFPWMPLFLSFQWPSIPYALDILAWDVFFALSALFAAAVFRGNRLARSIRILLFASGALALAGLSGVFAHNMQLRNIGIVGYGVLFPVAALLLAILFQRATPLESA